MANEISLDLKRWIVRQCQDDIADLSRQMNLDPAMTDACVAQINQRKRYIAEAQNLDEVGTGEFAPAPPASGDECSPCPFCGGTGEHFVGSQAIGPCPRGCGDNVPIAPSATPGLLAAAQAVVDDAPVCPCPGCREEHEGHLDALRAELAAAPTGPVALTDADRAAIGRALALIRSDGHYSTTLWSHSSTNAEQQQAWQWMDEARKAFTLADFAALTALARTSS